MRIPDPSPLAVVGLVVSAFGLISCGGVSPVRIADVRTTPRIGTTIVASAHMTTPEATADILRSCAGPRLCREDALTTADPEALGDVEAACARTGGTFGPRPCPRAEASASCSGGTEHGTLTVFVYERGAQSEDLVERVSEQCEALGGTFELSATRIAR